MRGVVTPASEKARKTRRQILESARAVFAKNGYQGTPTIAIAEHAGISEGMIFRYFGSKENLAREIFLGTLDRFASRLIAETTGMRDIRKVIRVAIAVFMESVEEDRDGWQFILLCRHEDFAGPPPASYLKILETGKRIFQKAKRQGVLRNLPTELLNASIFGIVAGLLSSDLLTPSRKLSGDKKMLNQIMEVVWRGIGSDKGRTP